MAVIKVMRNTYGGTGYIRNLCAYIHDSEYMIYCSGYSVCAFDHEKAADEMIVTRRFFHKESGNPLFHIVIAFDDSIKDKKLAWSYLVKIAGFFMLDHQVYFGMHGKDNKCPHLHGHLLINSVSFVNGKMLNTDVTLPIFKGFIERTIGQECIVIYEDKKNS